MRGLTDMVSSGWAIFEAYAINDFGLIAAGGSFQGGPEHALVLTPVSEPGSLVLFGLGVGAIAFRRKRKGVNAS
jgi:hypothetical protein